MNKYSEEIESDFYKLVKASSLAKAVSGKVYRFGFRPAESKKEDIIIEYKEGTESDVQVGFVYVRVYVPNVSINLKSVKDAKRCIEIQKLVGAMYKEIQRATTEYLIQCYNTPTTVSELEIQQHYISAYIKYKRLKIKE